MPARQAGPAPTAVPAPACARRTRAPGGRHRTRLQPAIQCLHKEYARQSRQEAAQAQQHGHGGAAPSAPAGAALLSTPEDVVLEALTVLRRGELSSLRPYLPAASLAPPGAPVLLAGVPVHEQGPLARTSPFMDTAARRVLPGHLLRRARVLSSLCVGGSCLLRVALTACTGEEATLVWRLGLRSLPGISTQADEQQQQEQREQQQQLEQLKQEQEHTGSQQEHSCSQQQWQAAGPQPQDHRQGHDLERLEQHQEARAMGHDAPSPSPQQQQQQQQPACSNSSSSDDGDAAPGPPRACWQVLSVARDTSQDTQALPSGPHPRAPPELVVLAQLQALRRQQLVAACAFNLMGRRASGGGWDAHLQAFGRLLQQGPYGALLHHARAELGASALPNQRQFLQEVVLYDEHDKAAAPPAAAGGGLADAASSSSSGGGGGGGGGDGGAQQSGGRRFLWRLGMHADGCWVVRSIEVL